MAISKIILNGETQMDVTSDTVVAGSMLSGTTATKNDGTKVTGTITTKTSSDLTASGATVTAPAGYYANAASKAVTTTTHPNPTASITSSTGVVTASHTQTTGYVTSGTTTGTLNLTTQAAQTINTSTADQTIASYRWLTGTQTIKSVTTSNLTAANIAEGVVVRVGDANNASRIAQVTGTHSGATSYTATISGSGNTTYCYVTYSGTKYYSNNGTFSFKAGDTLTIYCRGNSVSINGQSVTLSSYSYTYTLPVGDITINLTYSSSTNNNIAIYGLVKPTGAYTVSAAGTHNIYSYSQATVATGSAFPPSVTITKAPTFSMNSATGVVTASYTGSSSITPTVTSGYITAGTAGTVSTSGTSTYQLASQAAQTIYPSTADQTIASYRWLTGTQTIKSVTTSNLTADNIAEGVVVRVGDSSNASRITQVTGTYSVPIPSYYDVYQSIVTALIINPASISGFDDWVANVSFLSGPTFAQKVLLSSSYIFSQLNSIPSGFYCGEDDSTNGQDTSKTFIFPKANRINRKAFSYRPCLLDVQASICTFISDKAFTSCAGLTSVTFPSCSIIGSSAFAGCVNLITADFPACTRISSYAFRYCSSLTMASFPVCTSIGDGAFNSCYCLTTVSFPACTTICSSAFNSCSSLTTASFSKCNVIENSVFVSCSRLSTISFPACTTIGTSAFAYCYSLTMASFPVCTTMYSHAFAYCSSLTMASFPVCPSIGLCAFHSCSSLTTASFPACTTIGSSAFAYCYSLTTASFPKCNVIENSAFRNCYNLLSLYLLGSSVVSLTAIGVFSSTPISTYTTSTGGVRGTIYVPSSLYAAYTTATNWTAFSSRMVSM